MRKADRNDQVIASSDDLNFGPINPGDSASRAKWVANELGQADWKRPPTDPKRAWEEARFPDNRKIAWLTRRSASEYAGFLDWLWRLGDAPCEVVDLSEVTVSYRPEHGLPGPPHPLIGLGMLHPDKICSDKLWDLAEPLQTTERRRYLDVWRELRLENAPLRVIDDGRLVSAPISFFDLVLMSHVTEDWQSTMRVVGHALIFQTDDNVVQTGDVFLAGRINKLVEQGCLEIRGNSALEMSSSEVRLPAPRPVAGPPPFS